MKKPNKTKAGTVRESYTINKLSTITGTDRRTLAKILPKGQKRFTLGEVHEALEAHGRKRNELEKLKARLLLTKCKAAEFEFRERQGEFVTKKEVVTALVELGAFTRSTLIQKFINEAPALCLGMTLEASRQWHWDAVQEILRGNRQFLGKWVKDG